MFGSKKIRFVGISFVIIIITNVCVTFWFPNISHWVKLPITEDQMYNSIQQGVQEHIQEFWTNVVLYGKNIDMLEFVQIEDIHKNLNGIAKAFNRSRSFQTDENLRRRLEFFVNELWLNIRAQEHKFDKSGFVIVCDIYRKIKSDLLNLRAADGHEIYRANELAKLSNLIQNRLHKLQNPLNCESAQKLVYHLSSSCGFACSAHEICFALITAYATGRTLILNSEKWRYNRYNGIVWETAFQPISQKCDFTHANLSATVDFASNYTENAEILSLPSVFRLKPKPEYSIPSIPADIAERLEQVHEEPHVWWVGQFLKFILKLQPEFQDAVRNVSVNRNRLCPTVGVHIRRTDKLEREAKFHSLQDYMSHVEDYFSILDHVGYENGCGSKRRVFIATDDPAVLVEANKIGLTENKYLSYRPPEWEILGNAEIAESAQPKGRYELNSLVGTISDVFTLAETDFLVCTFSSNICRVAYELMQTKGADASGRFISLDNHWIFYSRGDSTRQIATIEHRPLRMNEIELQINDELLCRENYFNGTSFGYNSRSRKWGTYPSYKVRPSFKKVDFPAVKWWKSA